MLELDVGLNVGHFKLSAAFQTGEGLTALIGPSGAGKTSLANIVAGLTRPHKGSVHFNDEIWFDAGSRTFVPPHKRRIGYVFQEGRLFPHLNVRQNLEYARRYRSDIADPKADEKLIDLLGIGHLLERAPTGLSGGEKSRVAIGRALFSSPQLLIMDEPLAALDPERKGEILPHLEYIRDETGIPILYVSHALDEVARLANHVISVVDGHISATGSPADVLSGHIGLPPTIPPGTFLEARVQQVFPDEDLIIAESLAGPLYLRRADATPGDVVRVHIPASEIMLARGVPENVSALNRLEGRIEDIAERGKDLWVIVDCGGARITAQVTRRSAQAMALATGQTVCLLFKSVSIARQGLYRRHV